MIEKIKNIFIKIATLGSLGYWFFGGIVSAIFAVPFLYIMQLFYTKFPAIFHSIWGFVTIMCLVSIYIALKEHKNNIVLHKFIGVMIAFYLIPLTIKILGSGVILFYLSDYMVPLIIFKNSNQSEMSRIKQLFYLLIPSILSGIIVNLFLHLILWIAH